MGNAVKDIEIGHAFLLETKYSKVFNATFKDNQNKFQHFQMGCYGLGISRLFASAFRVSEDGSTTIWPKPLAPYQLAIIPRVDGLLEAARLFQSSLLVQQQQQQQQCSNFIQLEDPTDTILDDRVSIGLGNKIMRKSKASAFTPLNMEIL